MIELNLSTSTVTARREEQRLERVVEVGAEGVGVVAFRDFEIAHRRLVLVERRAQEARAVDHRVVDAAQHEELDRHHGRAGLGLVRDHRRGLRRRRDGRAQAEHRRGATARSTAP